MPEQERNPSEDNIFFEMPEMAKGLLGIDVQDVLQKEGGNSWIDRLFDIPVVFHREINDSYVELSVEERILDNFGYVIDNVEFLKLKVGLQESFVEAVLKGSLLTLSRIGDVFPNHLELFRYPVSVLELETVTFKASLEKDSLEITLLGLKKKAKSFGDIEVVNYFYESPKDYALVSLVSMYGYNEWKVIPQLDKDS